MPKNIVILYTASRLNAQLPGSSYGTCDLEPPIKLVPNDEKCWNDPMQHKSSDPIAALTVLKHSAWFGALPDALLGKIARLSVQRKYDSGELLFQRGEPGDYLHGVIAGSVRIVTVATDGRELALNTMRAGDIIGEIAVLDGGVRTASSYALEPTTTFVIHRDGFRVLMSQEPPIANHMIRLLCERVRSTSAQVEEVAFLSLPQRLERRLQKFVEETGMGLPCTVKVSQSELASFINASRQAVNGVLQTWAGKGLVELSRGSITIVDLEGISGLNSVSRD